MFQLVEFAVSLHIFSFNLHFQGEGISLSSICSNYKYTGVLLTGVSHEYQASVTADNQFKSVYNFSPSHDYVFVGCSELVLNISCIFPIIFFGQPTANKVSIFCKRCSILRVVHDTYCKKTKKKTEEVSSIKMYEGPLLFPIVTLQNTVLTFWGQYLK